MTEQTIKVLSWNVEHFKTDKVEEVIQVISQYDPDIFGLYEVEAGTIYDAMLEHFSGHSVFLTTGQQNQEILVACRNSFEGIKFQQKDEFKSGNPALRPGVFLTFRYPNASLYGLLFLHTDSGTGAVDFGNRNEMFEHSFNLKRKVDHITDSATNFMILGDLNTMGLKYPKPYKSDQIADTLTEVEYIDYESQRKGKHNRRPHMRRLTKPTGTHFSTTYGITDLDHIIAAEHLRFKPVQNFGEVGEFEVLLDGWRRFYDDPVRMRKYAAEVSDHCLLVSELLVDQPEEPA